MLTLATLAVAATLAGAGPYVTDVASSYDVRGVTYEQLATQLRTLDGEWTGKTEYRIAHSWRLWPVGTGCQLRDLRVDVRITTTLPRWLDETRAPVPLRRSYGTFFDALRRHEGNHRAIAINAAQLIAQRLSGIKTSWSCDRLRPWVKREATKLIDWARDENRRYDERTNHGAKEGVTLNP